MKLRETLSLFAALGGALGVAVVLATGDDAVVRPVVPAVEAAAAPSLPPSEPVDVPAPAPAPEPELRERFAVPIDWFGEAPQEKEAEAKAEERPAFRGQLVVGRDMQPLGGLTLRLTRAWLGTVLPQPGEDTTAARHGRAPLQPWRGETNPMGFFTIPDLGITSDLFLVVDPDGRMEDVVRLRRPRWYEGTVDLGIVTLDARGVVAGALVAEVRETTGEGEGPVVAGIVAGATVRAIDVPMAEPTVGADQRENALVGARTVHEDRVWATQRGVFEVPDWIRRRDAVLPFPRAKTEADGSFVLSAVRPGTVRLVVQTPDGRDFVRDVTVQPRRVTEVEIPLPDRELAELFLLDEKDNPVDATVRVMPSEDVDLVARLSGRQVPRGVLPPRRTTGGIVTVARELLPGGRALVRRAEDWPWESLGIEFDAAEERFEVVLPPLGQFEVKVMSTAGVAVGDASVTLLPDDGPLGARLPRLAEDLQPIPTMPGTWRSPPLPTRSHRVLVRAEGFAPTVVTAVAAAETTPVLVVDLFPTFPLSVRATGLDGQAVSGARVTVLPHAPDERNRDYRGTGWVRLADQPVRLGVTGPDGTLRADGFWDNSFSITVRHPEHGVGLVRVRFPVADTTIAVGLSPLGSVGGVVTDRGAPPSEALTVTARPSRALAEFHGWHRELESVTGRIDSDGRFKLGGLMPGEWELVVTNADDVRRSVPLHQESVVVRTGGNEYVDLEVRHVARRFRLHGEVRLNGLHPDDAVVTLERSLADRLPRDEEEMGELLGRLPRAKHRFMKKAVRREIDRLLKGTQPFRMVSRVDLAGRYEFGTLPPFGRGTTRLSLERVRNGRTEILWSQPVETKKFTIVRARRAPIEVVMDIDITVGTVRAQVVTLEGPLANRELRVILAGADDRVAFPVVTDAAGEIVLLDVPAGEYLVRAPGETGGPVARLTVMAGEDRGVRVMLE